MADLIDRARTAVTDRAELPGMSLMEHLGELRKRLIHSVVICSSASPSPTSFTNTSTVSSSDPLVTSASS